MKRIVALALAAACAGVAAAADTPVRLARPGFPPPVEAVSGGGTQLELVSSVRRPVDETAAWVRRNGLDLREFNVPGTIGRNLRLRELPSFVAREYRGLRLVRAIAQTQTILLFYGRDFASARVLVAVNLRGRVRYALDFLAFGGGSAGSLTYQQLVWAAEAGGVLYVANAHPTYASSSRARNAYVTAVDLSTRKVRWRSAALVANAQRFELYGNLIVTGYGFTAEPDYLYLLDRRTGRASGRLSLPTAPEYVVRKGRLLYVRTYDHDVVARLAAA